jgi:hypothetical protein
MESYIAGEIEGRTRGAFFPGDGDIPGISQKRQYTFLGSAQYDCQILYDDKRIANCHKE